jgi:hypothetical protein
MNKYVGKTFGTLNKRPIKLDRYFQGGAVKFVMQNVGSYEPKVLCEAFAQGYRETLKKGEPFPKFAIIQCIINGIIPTESYCVHFHKPPGSTQFTFGMGEKAAANPKEKSKKPATMKWEIILRQIRAGEECPHYKVVEGEGQVCQFTTKSILMILRKRCMIAAETKSAKLWKARAYFHHSTI